MSQYIMPISETMQANVDIILNEASSPDNPNTSSINVTERPMFGSYMIECMFFGDNRTNNERFEITPFEIVRLTIEQNFNTNYTDEISLVVSLMPAQYLQMYDNSRGLKCSLKFTPMNKNTMKRETAPTIIKEYLVVFKDKSDIRKRYSKEALVPESRGQMTQAQQGALIPDAEFQLIDETAYRLRKIKFNFIARQVTIKDAILLICKLCHITKAAIVQPDNDKLYENFYIPPSLSFDQTMIFLQSYYGVYDKGLGFYYTDGVLYVFPECETKPTTPESAHLYYVGNSYTGNDVNHAMADSVTHIVLSGFSKEKDLQDTGSEMEGTSMIIQDATRIIDNATTIGESNATGLGKVSVNELNTSVFSANKLDLGMVYNAYQPMFRFDDSNPYKLRELLNAYRRVIVSTQWDAAVPFTFKPGYCIYYHYDGENIAKNDQGATISSTPMYTTKTGICSGVSYTFLETGRHGGEYVHTCQCDLVLSLEYTPANKEPSGNTVSNIDSARSNREVSTGGRDVRALAGNTMSRNGSSNADIDKNVLGLGPKIGLF
nr:MAG TPA: hypothetical protein [Bacteriophage sp.]